MAVRVFLDTNVWLSAVVFPGLCAELLLELDARGHRLLTSALVREEVHAVMQRKFPRHAAAVERFDALWADATRVPDVVEPADEPMHASSQRRRQRGQTSSSRGTSVSWAGTHAERWASCHPD